MNYQILGNLSNNDGVYDEETGETISPPTFKDTFAINSTQKFKDLDHHLVTPSTPRVVFGGVTTYFYEFESEEQAKELLNYSVEDDGEGNLIESYNPVYEPLKEPVPKSVTKRQARQQLILMQLVDDVQTVIDSIEDPLQRALVDSYWNDCTIYERNHPQMIALAQSLGLSEDQLDDAFIAASKLP